MFKNIKLSAVAVVVVGLVVRANGVIAQESAPPQTGADQIISISGMNNVPEASLFWPKSIVQETLAEQIKRVSGIMVPEAALFLDSSMTAARELTPPAAPVTYAPLDETAAEQIMRVSGSHTVPEAALNWRHFELQESGASQIKRVSGASIPEASLFLGVTIPSSVTTVVADKGSETAGN